MDVFFSFFICCRCCRWAPCKCFKWMILCCCVLGFFLFFHFVFFATETRKKAHISCTLDLLLRKWLYSTKPKTLEIYINYINLICGSFLRASLCLISTAYCVQSTQTFLLIFTPSITIIYSVSILSHGFDIRRYGYDINVHLHSWKKKWFKNRQVIPINYSEADSNMEDDDKNIASFATCHWNECFELCGFVFPSVNDMFKCIFNCLLSVHTHTHSHMRVHTKSHQSSR